MDSLGLEQNSNSKRQKVLFVATQDSFIKLFQLPYLKMFQKAGYEVHVATESDKPIKYCDKKIKISIKRSPFDFSNNIKAVRELKKIIDEEKYEMIHCHTPMGGVVARLAGKKYRRNGLRMIYTAHGFHFYKGAPIHFWLMFYPVEWYLAKHTDTLITINNEDYELALRRFRRRCRDIQYVPGVGVNSKKFSQRMSTADKNKYRKVLGLKPEDKVLICNGRLDANKNQEFLIRVMKKLVKKDPLYHLLLVGLDENSGKCQKLVLELKLQDNVHFLGFHKDIPELLQVSDVVLSASKREGLPVSLIEAAMMGLPIVATDCRGNRDVCMAVGEKIVGQEDVNGFARAVMNVFNGNQSKNEGLRRDFVEKHDVDGVVKIMTEIYNKKKRVLHVLSSNKYSGAENVACTIITNLVDKFDMVYCSPRGPVEKILKERGVKYIGIDKLNHKNLKAVVKNFRPDIIHAHDYRASLVASRFGKKYEVVSHIHLDNPKVRKFGIWSVLYWISASKYKNIIWVSESAFKNYYFKNSKRIKKKSIVLRNVIDGKYIRAKANEYKVDDSFDLVFIGRLSEQKNPERAIEIVRMIKGYKNDIKMAMIGDGEKYNKIKKMIAEYGLQNNIKLYGFVGNPYPILKNAKILFMTSKFEGTPMVILEAQALGKPIVSTRVGGLEKLVKNGENGFLSDSDEELVRNVMKILNSKNVLEVGADCIDGYLSKLRNIYGSRNE